MEITRREMLKLSLLGSAALLLPVERGARTQLAISNRLPESRLPRPFQVPFVVPPEAVPKHTDGDTDYYEMTMKSTLAPILPGLPPTEIWGYDGITPGPTIRSTVGRTTVVRHINGLPGLTPFGTASTTSVHLHGNASPPQYDGWAEDLIKPGFYKDYQYPNGQDAHTLWYHDHALHRTTENTYLGLAGFYITHDDLERGLPLPKGDYDVPIMIQDKIFTDSGQLVLDEEGESNLFGDVVLVNGAPWPVMEVERRKYRFRVLNASNSRSYGLALSTGEPLIVVGSEGGLMPTPQPVGSLRLGMAERYEIVVDFARYDIGQQVILQNQRLENNQDYPSTNQIMRFDVVREATDTTNNAVPEVLNPQNATMNLRESQAARTRDFVLEHKGGQWTINRRIWDPNLLVANPGLNDVEIWRFTNDSGGWFHPMHAHLIDFKVLDRDGGPPFPYELGPKDTAYVGENETVRVIARFGSQEGKYMLHCHNTVHEDHDMMVAFEVGTGGPDPVTTDPAKPVSEAGPLWTQSDDNGGGGETTTPGTTTPRPKLKPKPKSKPRSRRPKHRRRKGKRA